MTDIIIKWQEGAGEICAKRWDSLLRQAVHCALQQAWGYGEIFSRRGQTVARFVAYDGAMPVALGQVVTRRIFRIFHFSLLLRGPVWLRPVTPEVKQRVLQQISQRYPRRFFALFAISPPLAIPPDTEDVSLYKTAGFRQAITESTHLMIDLRLSETQLWQGLYGKTRTDIRKAEKADCIIQIGDHTHPHLPWLLAREKKQQKEKKYQGMPIGLVGDYGHVCPDEVPAVYSAFVVEKVEHKNASRPISGAVFLCHGASVTYHVGWNGPRGRALRGLSRLLWVMMLRLKADGFTSLDLGGINTAGGADIARFKMGFGGAVCRQAGTLM